MQSLLPLGIHKLLFQKLLAGLRRYKEFSAAQCAARQAVGTAADRPDVFNHLLRARHPSSAGPLFSDRELVCESSLLIIAGSDTTSTCLAATLFYLLHSPEALRRATTEVRAAFGELEDVRGGPALNACVFLRACIDEALRLSPPVGGLMPREVLPGGFAVDGLVFPEGTEVGAPHYALHHKPEHYPDPFAFKPERWLEEKAGAAEKASEKAAAHTMQGPRAAFCAWSIGPRNCVGKAMAYLELMLVLARLLWEFEMRIAPGSTLGEGGVGLGRDREREGEYQLWDTFASRSQGPMVEFRVRGEEVGV
jgi:cytochrome P450